MLPFPSLNTVISLPPSSTTATYNNNNHRYQEYKNANLIIPLEYFMLSYVQLQQPISNTIIKDADYIRLHYQYANLFQLNALYLSFKLSHVYYVDYQPKIKKYKIILDIAKCATEINQLVEVERQILSQYMSKNPVAMATITPIFRIKEYVDHGFLKISQEEGEGLTTMTIGLLLLRISGIWVTDKNCGLTFKFLANTQNIKNPVI